MINFEHILDTFRKRAQVLWNKFTLLSKRERNIALGAALVLSVLIINDWVIKPLREGAQNLEEKIKVQEKNTIHHMRSVAQKPKVDQAYENIMKSVTASGTSDDEARSGMLHDIEEFARNENLYLSEVKPQVSVEKGDFREFSVRVQADGTLEQLILFISDLVKVKRLYTIDNFRMIAHPEDVHKVRASITVTREVFLK